jgi:hypothetical protein
MERLGATPVLCLVAAMTSLLGPAAYASFSYDFSTQPPATFVSSGELYNGALSPTFSSSVSGGVLHLSDTTHPGSGGAFLGTATETSQVFTDVRAAATLNPAGTSNNILNVSVRYSPATGNAYAVGVDFQDGTLLIGKIVADRPVQSVLSTDPSQGSQLPLNDLARSYFLQVDAVGNHVAARLYDSPGGDELLALNYTDTGAGGPAFVSGLSGVSAVSDRDGRNPLFLDGTFDNFASTAVPEPGVAGAGAFLGLTLLQRRRARRPG